jgi:alpha-galactosidase
MRKIHAAKFKERIMLFTRFSVMLALALAVLSAGASEPLRINGPETIGVVTDRPFLFLIPATGDKDLKFSAFNLPLGLNLDQQTGIISGVASLEGEYAVQLSATDNNGTYTKTVKVIVGKQAIALTPIMGWNPWYVWGCNIDDTKIRQAADLLVSSGLAAHGYNYINLDDCWQGKRNAQGEMVPNAKFPNMKALADYVHSKGLRIGMYTSPGNKTCGGYEGTKDHDFEKGVSFLEKDVDTYAKWGFDFIKYDWCIFPSDPKVQDYYWSKQKELYKRMTDAIERSSRSMVHMLCQYGELEVWKWAPSIGGNMWRTNHDLADTWPAVLRNGFANIKLAPFQSPGHWNDLDMLMVGKANWPKKLGDYDIPGTTPRPTQLTADEQLTHMTLWSMMASPLLFSSDLTQLDPATLKLLNNDDMIAVNQDSLGSPAYKVREVDGTIVLARKLQDGSLAVALFNLNPKATHFSVTPVELGFPERTNLRTKNIWSGEVVDGVMSTLEVDVPAHGAYFVKMSAL